MIIIETEFGNIVCENVMTANSLVLALHDARELNGFKNYDGLARKYKGWIEQIHGNEEYKKIVFG